MTTPRLLFQRWIEVDPPEGVGREAPMWSWPVALRDGRTVLTLLYRPLAAPGGMRSRPRTQILEVSAEGEAGVWGPGAGYPSPVIFHAGEEDVLWGLDLSDLGKVYACRADGTHVLTAGISVQLGNLIAPEFFLHRGDDVWWVDGGGKKRHGMVRGGEVVGIESVAELPAREEEVRFPHTHVTGGRLYVMDFDPMARVSVYAINAER